MFVLPNAVPLGTKSSNLWCCGMGDSKIKITHLLFEHHSVSQQESHNLLPCAGIAGSQLAKPAAEAQVDQDSHSGRPDQEHCHLPISPRPGEHPCKPTNLQ